MSETSIRERTGGSGSGGSGSSGSGSGGSGGAPGGSGGAPIGSGGAPIVARRMGFWHDLFAVGHRAVILLPRDMAAILPALIVPIFFYAVTIGALQEVASFANIGLEYKAFQLPLALVMTVTGISRAHALVLDVQGGYFDRLLLTPVNRWALLLGMFVADTIVLLFLSLPVLGLGLALGVRFATGAAGIITFVAIITVWGLAYTGFPYAIALRTGNPTAVNNSFLLFFPMVFLTPAWMPRDALTGWLAAIATWNPVTYIIEGLRTLFIGWDGAALGKTLAAVAGMGTLSQYLAFSALKRRTTP